MDKKINIDVQQLNISPIDYSYKYQTQKGLNEDIVKEISKKKKEPQWMTEFRLKAYKIFINKKNFPRFILHQDLGHRVVNKSRVTL